MKNMHHYIYYFSTNILLYNILTISFSLYAVDTDYACSGICQCDEIT